MWMSLHYPHLLMHPFSINMSFYLCSYFDIIIQWATRPLFPKNGAIYCNRLRGAPRDGEKEAVPVIPVISLCRAKHACNNCFCVLHPFSLMEGFAGRLKANGLIEQTFCRYFYLVAPLASPASNFKLIYRANPSTKTS